MGLQPKKQSFYLRTGQATHAGVQAFASGSALDGALGAVDQVWDEASADNTVAEENANIQHVLREQRDLSHALTIVWAKERWPAFDREYRLLVVEPELRVTLYETDDYQVVLMVRPDGIIERRADGALLMWELKTKSSVTTNWIRSWEHNLQLIAQMLAVGQWAKENGFEDRLIAGALIEALLKGSRRENKAGLFEQQSNLIYGYVKPGSISGDPLLSSFASQTPSWEWKKGHERILISTLMPLREWIINTLPSVETAPKCPIVPIATPTEYETQMAARQWGTAVIREYESVEAVEFAKTYMKPSAEEMALDLEFPMNTEHCFRYGKCGFYDMCWSPAVQADPLNSGFQVREPNHPEGLDE